MISGAAQIKGLHEGVDCFFYRSHWEGAVRFTWATILLPENNTLFGAALRTISRLIDNGISLVR
jgi:hypothetical protein